MKKSMFSPRGLRIAACLACTAFAAPSLAQDPAPSEPTVVEVEEVVVFARSQSESSLQVPQSVDVLDDDLLRALNTADIGDVLRFVPGASRDGSSLDAFGDTYLMRGFYASQTVNGIAANRLNHARDAIAVERIEVLKGPASVLYGQLQPGAVVNVVTKQPPRDRLFEASVEGARHDQYRATIDLGGPLDAERALRYRVTGAYEDSDSFIDYWQRQHSFLSTALAYAPTDHTDVVLEVFHTENHWDAFYNGVPAEGTVVPNPNGRIPRSRGIADPSFDGVDRENQDVTLRVEHRFSDRLRYRGAVSWTREHADGEELFGVLGWEDDTKRRLTRALLKSDTEGDAYLLYNDMGVDFATGPLAHELIVGADLTHFARRNRNDIGLTSSLDVFTPEYSRDAKPEVFFIPDFSGVTDENAETYGVFVQDRLKLGERWHVVAGVRYAGFDQRVDDTAGTGERTRSQQTPEEWTTQFGLLYQPMPTLTLFGNRSTSFLPVQGTTTDGGDLEPETGTQYEVGAKGSFLDQSVVATVAWFELTRGDVAVSDRDDPSALIPIGEQRARGIEASLRGRLADGWWTYLAYAYTDAETTEDTNAVLVGKPIRNVPENTASLATNVELRNGVLQGLGFGAAVNYVDERAGDVDGSFTLPDYWRTDAFATWRVARDWELRAAIENLFDETYYEHAFSLFEVWPGAPRTYRLALRVTL